MSLDLFERETAERVGTMAPVQEPEAGVFDGFVRGAGLTTMRNLARTARGIDILGSVGPIVKDAVSGGTELQDRYFKEHDEVWGSAVDYWTPKPNEVGIAGQIVGELASMLPMVLASPGLAVGSYQLGTAEDLMAKGVDAGKAQAVGAAQAAGLGLGIWMPIFGSNLWQRVALGGVGFNVLQGVGMRAAGQVILEGTPAANEFKAFDAKALTLDVLMGAAFGGMVHLSPSARAQGTQMWERMARWAENLPPTQKSAIVALRLAQHLNLDSTPGIPVGSLDVEAHVNRVRTAIEQLERGQRVEVSALSEGRFEPDEPRMREMARHAEELTHQAARVMKAEGLPPPESQVALRIEPYPDLTPEMRTIETRFSAQVLGDVDGAIKAYAQLPDSAGGKILNTDLARELSPDYSASLESRARNAAAVHEPASALVKEMYARALDKTDPTGFNMVTFTAGGTGAGKTGAIARTPLAKRISDVSQVVYDTNMNGFKSAVDKIDMALAKGKQVNILWVGRDPVESLKGALVRAKKIGRTVPLSEHAKTHIGAAAVAQRLMEKYDGNQLVQFVFIDNGGAKGQVKIAGPDLPRSYDFDNLETRLKETLDAEHKAGRVPDHIYQGFAGHEPGRAGEGPGRVGAGQPGAVDAGVRAGEPGAAQAPREELGKAGGKAPAPKPGEKIIVYRLGESGELANRNGGNADSVARYIMGTEDFDSPINSKATKVFAYEVDIERPFGKYEGLTAGAKAKGKNIGRVVRDNEVAYSFPEGGKVKALGSKSLKELHALLKTRGLENFDDAGSIKGAQIIREAFADLVTPKQPEAPAAKPGDGAAPPPPRGAARPMEAAGAEGSKAKPADPVSLEADRMVTESPDMPIRTGTDSEGNPIITTARQYLEDARAAAADARADVNLFEAAARCLLGGA